MEKFERYMTDGKTICGVREGKGGRILSVQEIVAALTELIQERDAAIQRAAQAEAELNFFRNQFPSAARNWSKLQIIEANGDMP